MINEFSITFVVSDFPSISQTFVALQIDELIARGYRVVIVRTGHRGEQSFLPGGLQAKYASLEIVDSSYRLQNRRWKKKLLLCGNILLNAVLAPLPTIRTLRLLIKNGNIQHFKQIHIDAAQFRAVVETDIVHCQFSTLGARYEQLLRFGFLKKKLKKLAVSIRGYDISAHKSKVTTDWHALFRTFDLFLPVCLHFEKRLRDMGCDKIIAVIGSPVNTAELAALFKSRAPNAGRQVKLLSLCRLVEKKGVDTAIEAISKVVHTHARTNVHYTIIGDGPLQKKLEQAVVHHNLGAYISLAGRKPTQEALREMSTADILLAPSKTASDGNSEGIPNVIKEAMALGLTVVSTTHSGIPELITHGVNGYLVPENDPDSLADIIVKLIADRKARDAVTPNAPGQIYETFSPERTTDKLLSLYRILLTPPYGR